MEERGTDDGVLTDMIPKSRPRRTASAAVDIRSLFWRVGAIFRNHVGLRTPSSGAFVLSVSDVASRCPEHAVGKALDDRRANGTTSS